MCSGDTGRLNHFRPLKRTHQHNEPLNQLVEQHEAAFNKAREDNEEIVVSDGDEGEDQEHQASQDRCCACPAHHLNCVLLMSCIVENGLCPADVLHCW